MAKNRISELVDAQYSECAWISTIARKLLDKIIKENMTIDAAYEQLQGMRKAVENTPGAC